MFGKKHEENLYFLKTGNYLVPFRGYFKNKKKLSIQLHAILDDSIDALVSEWEKSHKKKWEKKKEDIISTSDLCHSVQIIRIKENSPKIYRSFFVLK